MDTDALLERIEELEAKNSALEQALDYAVSCAAADEVADVEKLTEMAEE